MSPCCEKMLPLSRELRDWFYVCGFQASPWHLICFLLKHRIVHFWNPFWKSHILVKLWYNSVSLVGFNQCSVYTKSSSKLWECRHRWTHLELLSQTREKQVFPFLAVTEGTKTLTWKPPPADITWSAMDYRSSKKRKYEQMLPRAGDTYKPRSASPFHRCLPTSY